MLGEGDHALERLAAYNEWILVWHNNFTPPSQQLGNMSLPTENMFETFISSVDE